MESHTGEALSVLSRADGDGVLAPLVLAMAEVKRLHRVGGGAQGAMLQWMSSRLPLEMAL